MLVYLGEREENGVHIITTFGEEGRGEWEGNIRVSSVNFMIMF